MKGEKQEEKPAISLIPVRAPTMKPEKFDGTGDVDRFLDHFKVVGKANGWTDDEMALQLPACLTGAAFDFYRRLSDTNKSPLKELEASLRKEYEEAKVSTHYAQALSSQVKQSEETITAFSDRVQEAAKKAYPSFKATDLEEVCKSHFINGLPAGLRTQLLVEPALEKQTFRDLVRRARQLEQVLPSSGATAAVRKLDPEAATDSKLEKQVSDLTCTVNALSQQMEELLKMKMNKNAPGLCPGCRKGNH